MAPKILKITEKFKLKKVLDLGCGNGYLCSLLKINGVEVAGIDLDAFSSPRLQCSGNEVANFSILESIKLYCCGDQRINKLVIAKLNVLESPKDVVEVFKTYPDFSKYFKVNIMGSGPLRKLLED